MHGKYIAECIGTFALVFFGCGSIMLAGGIAPLVFGMVVATMIYAVGHISGAHFNPAVTFAFAITRHFPAKQILPYWLAQCAGSIAAIAAISFLMPQSYETYYGATFPTAGTDIAFAWEVLLSFFLMFVITAVATDTRAEGMMAGIAIGGIVMLAAYVGGPFSGASMNPVRSLAPALFAGNYTGLWIYLTAPFLGSTLGALTYKTIRCGSGTNSAQGCC